MATAASSPSRLGKYELLAELATGGMATVYVARDLGVPGGERLVVIKRVHRHLLKEPTFREMFQDEARLASLIRHPNVARLLDVIEENGELVLVLEYIESVSLSTLQRHVTAAGETLPPAVASRLVADILLGLHAAHETRDVRGNSMHIVHRDVSPQNVVVSADGVAHLIDFGIAKAAVRAAETTGGVVKGKLAYMSPEQAKGVETDRRSDVFSAGVVLFEAMTGRRLFPDGEGGGSDLLLRILLEPIELPSKVTPGLPPALDAVTEQALAQVRDERFPTAAAFHDALVRAVPPASAADVATIVDRACGALMRQRRTEILRLLESSAQGDGLRLGAPSPVPTLAAPEGDPLNTSAATKVATVMETTAARRGLSPWLYAVALGVAAGGALLWADFGGAHSAAREPSSAAGAPADSAFGEASAGSAPGGPATTAEGVAEPSPAAPGSTTPSATPAPVVDADATAARPEARPGRQHDTSRDRRHASPAPATSASARRDLHPENPY